MSEKKHFKNKSRDTPANSGESQDGGHAVCWFVVCNVLSFSLKKYGKHPLKTLKSMLIDFYEVDAIWSAKQQLLSDVDVLISADKLTNKPPSMPTKSEHQHHLTIAV